MPEAKGVKEKTLTITKVNGVENEAAIKTASFNVYTVSELVERRVAVEEFTGTGCGWCPRGMVGMEKLRKQFGDKFVGIALHQYNSSDAMYIATNSYAKIGFTGAPSCAIDRRYITDPYYGEGDDVADDFNAVLAIPALAGIEVVGSWNSDSTQVEAKATVQSLVDGADYNVEFVLVADGLTGTTSAWNQSNYYYQYTRTQVEADLAIFASGGKYGTSTIKGWTFNDVAISSSYVSGVNKATGFTNLQSTEEGVSEYTLGLPTKAALLNALKKDQIYVVALLVAKDGTIVNSAKTLVKGYGEDTGISAVTSQTAAPQVSYSLDGRQLQGRQKGLNIVRMSDGSVRKVIVR